MLPAEVLPGLIEVGFEKRMRFEEAVRVAVAVPDDVADRHFRSQTDVLLDRERRLRPDVLLRLERLQQDWRLLQRVVRVRTGVHLAVLPHKTVSRGREAWEGYYTDETRELVYKRYETDFEVLGYPPRAESAVPEAGAPDASIERELAKGARAVLDLTPPSSRRLAAVDGCGAAYLSSSSLSCIGQLVSLEPVRRGVVPESLFDVLVVPDDVDHGDEAVRWLKAQFESSGREVINARR